MSCLDSAWKRRTRMARDSSTMNCTWYGAPHRLPLPSPPPTADLPAKRPQARFHTNVVLDLRILEGEAG